MSVKPLLKGRLPVLLRIAAFLLVIISLPSFAQDRFGGSLGVTSDYVFRGISYTREQPAVQAEGHYSSATGWTIGAWGSNVEFGSAEGHTIELDAYLGYRWSLSDDWVAKVSAVHYEFPRNHLVEYDYNELVVAADFRNLFFMTVAWSPDSTRYSLPYRSYMKKKDAISYEAALALPVWNSLVVNFGAGYYDLHSVIDAGYAYWNVGVGYDWHAWHADVAYIGTSNEAKSLFLNGIADDRLVASVLWRF